MVVGLNERAAVRGNPLVVVLAAGLDGLTGIGVLELLTIERVKRSGMGRRIDRILPRTIVGMTDASTTRRPPTP